MEGRFIDSCLRSTYHSVLVNRSLTSEFHKERYVRQGDPLSHFLFLVVGEGINVSIIEAVNGGVGRFRFKFSIVCPVLYLLLNMHGITRLHTTTQNFMTILKIANLTTKIKWNKKTEPWQWVIISTKYNTTEIPLNFLYLTTLKHRTT